MLGAAGGLVGEFERLPVLLTCLLGLYGLIMLVSLLSLYFYHLNLIAINQTTNEVTQDGDIHIATSPKA